VSKEQIKDRLVNMMRKKSLRIGRFTLTSGKTSPYYFDAKPTTLDAEGSYLCAKLLLEEIKRRDIQAEAIGGLALGAAPIVSSVATLSYAERNRYRPLQAFIARKKSKGHGTGRRIEGFSGEPGTRVIVIDDVCTTGGSTLDAVTTAQEAGYRVVAVLCLVDREQGGAELLRDYPFYRILTGSELLDDPGIQKQLAELDPAH
jgi:orotate phosphoribosyltransferase